MYLSISSNLQSLFRCPGPLLLRWHQELSRDYLSRAGGRSPGDAAVQVRNSPRHRELEERHVQNRMVCGWAPHQEAVDHLQARKWSQGERATMSEHQLRYRWTHWQRRSHSARILQGWTNGMLIVRPSPGPKVALNRCKSQWTEYPEVPESP